MLAKQDITILKNSWGFYQWCIDQLVEMSLCPKRPNLYGLETLKALSMAYKDCFFVIVLLFNVTLSLARTNSKNSKQDFNQIDEGTENFMGKCASPDHKNLFKIVGGSEVSPRYKYPYQVYFRVCNPWTNILGVCTTLPHHTTLPLHYLSLIHIWRCRRRG